MKSHARHARVHRCTGHARALRYGLRLHTRGSLTVVVLAALARQTGATDLGSSQTGYVLPASGNPYVVVEGAVIDTRALGTDAIDGTNGPSGTTWNFTNNGTVAAGFWALNLGQAATVINNGVFYAPNSSALALFGGAANVTNSAGAVIAGKLDGVYAPNSASVVTNAGTISGDVRGIADSQAGIHLPNGGTVVNLPTGRIAGSQNGILAAPATTITNEGDIDSVVGAAIDLTGGTSSTGGSVYNSGTITGLGGAAILFGASGNTLTLTGTSVINGNVMAAGDSNTLILSGPNPGTWALSSLGRAGQYQGFTTLRKDGPGLWTLTGANAAAQTWHIGSGPLAVQGRLNGNLVADAGATGVAITVNTAGSVESSSANAIEVDDLGKVVNQGTIAATGPGAMAVLARGVLASVTNTGTVSAVGDGATAIMTGTNADMTNAGSIRAVGTAIDAGARSTITNTGSITGGTHGVTAASGVSIVNRGVLSGTAAAVVFTGDRDTLTLDTGSSVSGDINGGNGAGNALVLLGSGTLSSHSYGFASLRVDATAWSLDGVTSIHDVSTIAGGSLYVNAALISPSVTVASPATLGGTGVVQGALRIDGTVAPGSPRPAQTGVAVGGTTHDIDALSIGTLSVSGSYTQSSQSRYLYDVSPVSHDLVNVTGTADLNGGTLDAHLRANTFSAQNTYPVMTTTAGLSGTFAGVNVFSPFMRASMSYDANNAYLTITRSFLFAGGTPNQIAIEGGLMRGVGAAGTPQAPSQAWLAAVANLLNLEGADAYAGLDQLSAESYASVINADAHSVMTGLDSIANRLAAAHDGGGCPSVAPAFAPTVQAGNALCPWVRVVGDWTRLDGYDTWLSQRLDYGGIFIGLDGKLAGPWTLGGMLGYVHGSEATDGLPVHATSESYQAAAYGEYARGPVWLRGTVGLAFHTAQMSRQITFTDTPLTAVGDPDGTQYFADLRAGWDIPTARFGTFTPFVAVQAQRITAPGFTESGAGALSLAIGNASTTVSRSILGAQWSASLGGVASRWTAQANLGWAHAYGALTRVIQAQFVGAPASAFTEYGAGPARDTAEIGVGVSAAVGRNAHLTLRYDGNYGGHQSASALSLAADYRW